MRRVLILIISLFFSQFMVSCAYKPDVQQGNTLDDKQVSQLKVGMTRQQVVFIMGTALLKDPFHKNRWDYVYTYAKGRAKAERRLLTLYFKDDRLSSIDKSQLNKIILD
ncbi:MAG: outer membrane protein assembly factor BamE [Gammaproteobacteria bacterium]|nr:outer membrane protein assembly factor BamE [Gammaproteobacteria bacterium]MCW9031877.1 outer membrane protein assembly factor BamE [Gammaproteobacteria bacterium]